MKNEELKRTVLFEKHVLAGARIVPFAGFEMPVQYTSIMDEHRAVRTSVGMFDVSHMGEVDFKGPDALKTVQNLITNNAARMEDSQAVYSGLLYDRGTFVDDILVYRFAEDHYMFCVNASNADKDFAWIKAHSAGDVEVRNRGPELSQIAVQGPRSRELVQQIVDVDLREIRYYWFREGRVLGHEAIISRTGYTGEHGYELYVANAAAPEIWDASSARGKPLGLKYTGLGCRDTLRLEAGMALYGNDIDDTTTPLEAGLGWIVKLRKGDFIGSEVLRRQRREGLTRCLVGFHMTGRGIPRHGYPIVAAGKKIGEVTSGTHSPTLNKPIGMGYVPIEYQAVGTKFEIEIRGRAIPAEVISLPFYQSETK